MKIKKPENKPALKKVKIDDHIRASKKSSDPAPPRKRGRPRKNPGVEFVGGNNPEPQRNPSPSNFNSPAISASDSPPPTPHAFEPVYDTTEEAKGFLRTPFDLAAGLSGVPGLALYPAQLEAMAPSFKIVYDKHIKPHLGENPEIWAFGVVASGVIMEKIAIFKESQEKKRAVVNQGVPTNHSGYTPTPVNSNPVQTTQ